MQRQSPVVARKKLARSLRGLREAQKLTMVSVCAALGWQQSKLTRIETGQAQRFQQEDIAELLRVYGVPLERQDEYIRLSKATLKPGWWQPYRSLKKTYEDFVGLEYEARLSRNWEPLIVPGLLQTEEYARALMEASSPPIPEREIAELLDVRMERQLRLVHSPDPIELRAVIGEAALRQMYGGPDVIEAQLEHLIKLAQMPTISLQVLPFSHPSPPAGGPFAILQFSDPLDPEVVYVESEAGEQWVEDGDRVAIFQARFVQLMSEALARRNTIQMISEVLADIRRARK